MDISNIAVSVIVPVYNVASFLPRCLESVQRQTLKKLEIICVDDGSTDDSCKIIEHLQAMDSRIHLICQEHAGPGVARNLGIASAKGEYVSFLDSDDYYYETDALEKMYIAAKENKANVCSAYKMLKSWDNKVEDSSFIFPKPKHSTWIIFAESQNIFGFTNFLFRKNFLCDNDISFPERFYFEDPIFLLRVLSIAEKFLLIPSILYCCVAGYKSRNYTERSAIELLDGVYEGLVIANRKGYKKLFEILLDISHNSNVILNHITLDVVRKIFLVSDYVKKENTNDDVVVWNTFSNLAQQINYEQYVFPFHYFPRDAKIIIYGAGIVGQALYYQATKYGKGYVDIVGMVDRNAKFMEKGMFPVSDPSEISGMHGEYVLIACKTEGTATSIRNSLKKHGFFDKNILWDEDTYLKEAFYKKVLCSDFSENGGVKPLKI